MKNYLIGMPTLRFCCVLMSFLFPLVTAHVGHPSSKSGLADNNVFSDRLIVKFKKIPEAHIFARSFSGPDGAANKIAVEFERFYKASKKSPALSKSLPQSTNIEKLYYCFLKNHADLSQTILALSKEPSVEYVEPVFRYQLNAEPNDLLLVSQIPYLDLIEARDAWDVVKGDSGEVIVAVIDGGTDINHPDLAANIWVNADEIPANGIDDDNNGFVDDVNGWNFANHTNDPTGLPSVPFSARHGTKTAGIVGAVTDNGIGIAGMSWNAKLMAINASDPAQDRTIVNGWEGVVYAVENGADVINLSWGRVENASVDALPSLFEVEIINYAADQGCVIVASAGNDGDDFLNYPSAYPSVLSVANTTLLDVKYNTSNYGRTVDLTAPGVSILTTDNQNDLLYTSDTGTSFSSPLVAGAVALVKTLRPDWTGRQAAEQVRVNADNIDDLNPLFAGLLGSGRLNVDNAVRGFDSPSIRIQDLSFDDFNKDGVLSPGERATLMINCINYLAPVQSALATLRSDNPWVDIIDEAALISDLNTLDITTPHLQFEIEISPDAEVWSNIDFDLEISIGDYFDVDRFALAVAAQYENLDVNNIRTSITGNGRVGYADVFNQKQGNGFFHVSKKSDNLLYESAIIAGISENRISNSGRIFLNRGDFDRDFSVIQGGNIIVNTPGNVSDQESFVQFDDRESDTPVGIQITQETFASNTESTDDFIIFNYIIKNQNPDSLKNFHFGMFFDWDVIDWQSNSAVYLPSHNLGYVFKDSTFVGSAFLNNDSTNFSVLDNAGNLLREGFTDAEKWQVITSNVDSALYDTDVACATGIGPYDIAPGDSVEIGLALVAGKSESALQTSVTYARDWWVSNIVTAIRGTSNQLPEQFELEQNYPNPFNPTTQITYRLQHNEHVRLTVYNLLGQEIRTLVDKQQNAGTLSVDWDGRDDAGLAVASGVYIYRLQTESGFTQSKKMVLLK